MEQQSNNGRIIFAGAGHNIADEQQTTLTSVGIDIGSATCHIVFSEIEMKRSSDQFVVSKRSLLYESEILLTPFSDRDIIDEFALRDFLEKQYKAANLSPREVDTGALILTGTALEKKNAQMLGELFSLETGNFISVAAGDRLEAIMAAHGSGAIINSRETGATIMNVDIGGGTTKIAICSNGEIIDLTTVDIGARLIAINDNGCICRIEKNADLIFEEIGLQPVLGTNITDESLERVAKKMGIVLTEIILQKPLSRLTKNLHRLPPIKWNGTIDAVTFSGGVAEYIYDYSTQQNIDVGSKLASAIKSMAVAHDLNIMEPVESIRATVVGLSQYKINLSGTTNFIHPADILPQKNIPVIAPNFMLETDEIDQNAICSAILNTLNTFNLNTTNCPVALCFDWNGSAVYGRIESFISGVIKGMQGVLTDGKPLILVCSGDIGRVFGNHARYEIKYTGPIISIDGITLNEFQYIDIGAELKGSGAVPVSIKSLVFPENPNQ